MDFFQVGNVLIVMLVMINLGLYSFGLINLPNNNQLFSFLPNESSLSSTFDNTSAANPSDSLQQNLSTTASVTASGQQTPLPQSQIINQSIGGIFLMATLFPFWGVYAITAQPTPFPPQIIFFWKSVLLLFQSVYLLFLGLEIWKALPRGG